MTDRVWITDVAPRDGLQNESAQVPAQAKIDLINALAKAGVPEIEATAFVSPKWVPQLADAAEVMAGIERVEGVVYSALVPNVQGLDRALEAGVDKVCVFTAASEAFSQQNTNASIAETLERFAAVFARCAKEGMPIRAYVSTIVACPHAGPIEPAAVVDVVEQLLELGPCEIDLGDTIGAARPDDIDALLAAVGRVVPVEALVLHLHDSAGTAIACARRALDLGVRRFDASCGGLGGCPYAPGAPGNLSTSDLLELCSSNGYDTGIDASAIADAAQAIRFNLSRA